MIRAAGNPSDVESSHLPASVSKIAKASTTSSDLDQESVLVSQWQSSKGRSPDRSSPPPPPLAASAEETNDTRQQGTSVAQENENLDDENRSQEDEFLLNTLLQAQKREKTLALLDLQKRRVDMELLRSNLVTAMESEDPAALKNLSPSSWITEESDQEDDADALASLLPNVHELIQMRKLLPQRGDRGAPEKRKKSDAPSPTSSSSRVDAVEDAVSFRDMSTDALTARLRSMFQSSGSIGKASKDQQPDESLSPRVHSPNHPKWEAAEISDIDQEASLLDKILTPAQRASLAEQRQQILLLRQELQVLQEYKESISGNDAEVMAHELDEAYKQILKEGTATNSTPEFALKEPVQNAAGSRVKTVNRRHISSQQSPGSAWRKAGTDELIERLGQLSVGGLLPFAGADTDMESISWQNLDQSQLLEAQMASDEDAERIEMGMQEIVRSMDTIRKARDVAIGTQKTYLDELFKKLEAQMEELQEVQKNVSFFRRATDSGLAKFVAKGHRTSALPSSKPSSLHARPRFNVNSVPASNYAQQPFQTYRAEMLSSPGERPPQASTKDELRGDRSMAPSPEQQPTEKVSRHTSAWTEQPRVKEYAFPDLDEHFEPTAYKTTSSETHSKADRLMQKLFEDSKDQIYRSAAGVISKHESEPYFLLQLFKTAARLDTSYARQKLLMTMEQILEECSSEKTSEGGLSSPEKQGMRRSSVDSDEENQPESYIQRNIESRNPNPPRTADIASDKASEMTSNNTSPDQSPDRSDPKPLNSKSDVVSDVQDTLIAFIARSSHPVFTPNDILVMHDRVMKIVAPQLEIWERRAESDMSSAVESFVAESLKKYLNQPSDLGGVLIEEVGRLVTNLFYMGTEQSVQAAEQRHTVGRSFPPITGTPPKTDMATKGQSSGSPSRFGYHYARDCRGDCNWNHDVLDDLVARMDRHDWGDIMKFIANSTDMDEEDEGEDEDFVADSDSDYDDEVFVEDEDEEQGDFGEDATVDTSTIALDRRFGSTEDSPSSRTVTPSRFSEVPASDDDNDQKQGGAVEDGFDEDGGRKQQKDEATDLLQVDGQEGIPATEDDDLRDLTSADDKKVAGS